MRMWKLVLLLASPVFGQDVTSVYRDNVVIVVDASGSMGNNWTGTNDNKMSIAKTAMQTVLTEIDENTQIGIIVFRGGNSEWIYPLGPKNNAALTEAINKIETGGGTPLGTNIKKAADALVVQRQKQFGYGSYRLLIVTDGDATGFGEERKMKVYTPEVIARGISVDVIGVDMGKEHALAQIVGDNYRAADDPEALTTAISAVFAEVSNQDANDAAQSFEFLEGLDPALAKEMIGAFTKSPNHPIGEKPKLKPRPNKSSSADWDQGIPDESPNSGRWVLGGVVLVVIFGAILYRVEF